ncbi:MAG: radical SAM protein [Candidatus Omnitrophica bacterium]|nr:radical SAM protein [Candidatus Omnitrophota bacterium]
MNSNISGPIPRCVSLNLTNKCNQRCIYCEIGQGIVKPEKPLLVLDDIKWVIDQMNKCGISFLSLGGGEPLLFKDIFEIIRYAYKFKIKCSIMTNGMLLQRLSQDEIELLKASETAISVSIDSFSDEKEEGIRGVKDALSSPVESIKILVGHKIPVNILTVISSHNYRDLFDIVTNANRLGVDFIHFQPVIFISNYPEVEPVDNKKSFNVKPCSLPEIEAQFKRIVDFEKHNHVKTNVYTLRRWLPDYIKSVSSVNNDDFFFRKIINRFWCDSLYSTIAISYYGEILPCNMLKLGKTIKDRRGKGLLELWNDVCEPVRLMIKRRQYPDACRSCVCGFDSNILHSISRYPFSNFRLIFNSLVEKVKYKIFGKA